MQGPPPSGATAGAWSHDLQTTLNMHEVIILAHILVHHGLAKLLHALDSVSARRLWCKIFLNISCYRVHMDPLKLGVSGSPFEEAPSPHLDLD